MPTTLAIVRPPPGAEKIGRAPSELQSHDNLVCRLLLEKKRSAGEGQGRPGGGAAPPSVFGARRCSGAAPPRLPPARRCRAREAANRRLFSFFFRVRGPTEISPLSPPASFPS